MNHFATIKHMVRDAEDHADYLGKSRERATNYYNGVMPDTPADEGRSQFVTRDLRTQVKKVLPSIMRIIFGSDEVAEFEPLEEGDEEHAKQASDFINYVVMPETKGRRAIEDAIFDALLRRNGILKWWYEEKQCVKFSSHSGLTEDELAQLVDDDEAEIVERSERQEELPAMAQGPGGQPMEVMQPVTVYDVKIRREETQRGPKVASVPRERFLIDPEAIEIPESTLVGEKAEITRSELVRMGYSRKMVDDLPIAHDDEADEEAAARRDYSDDEEEAHRANQPIDYYDLYIRIDKDGDGIAELRHMTFAGGLGEANLLEDDEVDEVQFCDVSAMPQPHQWEGQSLADDLMDIQRVKTVLMRQTLDNLYWQNNPTTAFQGGAVEDEEPLYNPEFGKPVRIKQGYNVREAVQHLTVPFTAEKSFAMLQYMDEEAQDRTGVSDAASGMAPDALQNMTAKASAMIEQQGVGQIEYLVNNIAESLKPLFKGLLRLVIRHQDKPRTIRLRDEWVEFDPRHWTADMDMTVNTGLGAGTRERDMMVMQSVMAMQEKLLAGFGPDNPFVKPKNVHNALTKQIEAAGLRNVDLYFTEPDEQEVQAKLEAMRNQPDPEQSKLQAQMEMEKMKQQTQAAKEQAQMQADLTVKQAEIEAESKRQADELTANAALQEQKLNFEREKLSAEIALKRELAAQQRQDEIWKAQAASFGQQQEAANG